MLNLTLNAEDKRGLKAILRGKGCDPGMLDPVRLSYICEGNRHAFSNERTQKILGIMLHGKKFLEEVLQQN